MLLEIKFAFEIFSPTPSMHLQKTFIKEKCLASAVLDMYGTSHDA